ncbi:MAG: acyl carrier protein [Siphonobacter sp.]
MNPSLEKSKLVVKVIRKLLTDHFFISPEFFRLDRTFKNDFGFNSLEMTELIVMIEDRLGIQFPDEAIENIHNVRDLAYLTEQSLIPVKA